MNSNFGPKIDHSCGNIFPDDELNNFVVSTGGSSHDKVFSQTEIFDAEDNSWILVSENSKGMQWIILNSKDANTFHGSVNTIVIVPNYDFLKSIFSSPSFFQYTHKPFFEKISKRATISLTILTQNDSMKKN